MTEIRSYRTVFDLERRIYRVDRLRLNPGGVPVRGIVYFLTIAVAMLFAERLPLIGMFVRTLPWYVLNVGLPGAGATLFTLIKIEGRSFHLAARSVFRYSVGPRELSGLRPRVASDRRWSLQELVVLADGSDARLRRMRYTGPGAVLVRSAHIRSTYRLGPFGRLARRPVMTLAALPGKRRPYRGQVIALAAGVRLDVCTPRKLIDGQSLSEGDSR